MKHLGRGFLSICVLSFPAFSAPASPAIVVDELPGNPFDSALESQTSSVSLMPSSAGTLASIIVENSGSSIAVGVDISGLSAISFDPFRGEGWVDQADMATIRSVSGGGCDTARSSGGAAVVYLDEWYDVVDDAGALGVGLTGFGRTKVRGSRMFSEYDR